MNTNFFINSKFRFYLFLAALSTIGTWMQNVALGYFIYATTKNPMLVGLIAAMHILPRIFGGAISGMLVDRYGAKIIILLSQYFMLIAALCLSALTYFMPLNFILYVSIVIFFAAIINNLSSTAWPIFITSLVEDKSSYKALYKNTIQLNLAKVIGPLLAGGLLSVTSANVVFIINAVSFIPIIFFITIKSEETLYQANMENAFSFSNFAKTLRICKKNLRIQFLLVVTLLTSFTLLPISYLMPVYSELIKQGSTTLGILLGMYSLGASFSFIIIYLKKVLSDQLLLALHVTFALIFLFLFSFAHTVLVSLVLVFFLGYFSITTTTMLLVNIQTEAPKGFKGRMIGLYQSIYSAFLSFGTLFSSYFSELITIRYAFMINSLILAFLFMGTLFYYNRK